MKMKAIILIGGSGTRLYPVTQFVNKHFLPIYSKPMVYYPLSLGMLVGIKDYIFVINIEDEPLVVKLKNHLEKLSLTVSCVIQSRPRSLAEGLILVEDYIEKNDRILYLLGDNILYGHDVPKLLNNAISLSKTYNYAVIFGYPVKDPERFGVVEFDSYGKVISIEEKPSKPKSTCAVSGVYVFDYEAIEIAKKSNLQNEGELEITSVLKYYLNKNRLYVQLLGRGFAWFDAGTHESFLEAGEFVATIERRTSLMIACLEEIAYRNGWISRGDLENSQNYTAKPTMANISKKLAEEFQE